MVKTMADPVDFDNLPQRVKRVIERCRAGQKLCKQIRLKDGGDSEVTFLFEPSGKKAPPKSSDAAIKTGFLKPMGDGLFDADTSQTWIAA